MTPTRFPARATSTARLAVVFDLPVPPRNECVEMILAKRRSPDGKNRLRSGGRAQIVANYRTQTSTIVPPKLDAEA